MDVLFLTGIGLLSGGLSGLMGVGGGIIIVPALMRFMRFPIHAAIGTSLAVIVPTAVAGAMSHYRAGNVDLRTGFFVSLGSIAGAVLGARLGCTLPERILRLAFACFLVFMAIRIAFSR